MVKIPAVVVGALFSALWAFCPPFAHAQDEPINAERPGFTNTTATILPGHLEIEIGYLFERGSDKSRTNTAGDGFIFRVPTSSRSEVRFGLPAYSFSRDGSGTTRGFGDAAVSVKWRFLDAPASGKGPSLALIAQTTLPTGEPELRENRFQPQLELITNYDLSDLWGIQAEVLYARPAESGRAYNQYAASVSVSLGLTQETAIFLETYREMPSGLNAPNRNSIDTGITYILKNNTQFDVSFGTAITAPLRNDRFIGAGVSHRW